MKEHVVKCKDIFERGEEEFCVLLSHAYSFYGPIL
jgi:hypothetical protein